MMKLYTLKGARLSNVCILKALVMLHLFACYYSLLFSQFSLQGTNSHGDSIEIPVSESNIGMTVLPSEMTYYPGIMGENCVIDRFEYNPSMVNRFGLIVAIGNCTTQSLSSQAKELGASSVILTHVSNEKLFLMQKSLISSEFLFVGLVNTTSSLSLSSGPWTLDIMLPKLFNLYPILICSRYSHRSLSDSMSSIQQFQYSRCLRLLAEIEMSPISGNKDCDIYSQLASTAYTLGEMSKSAMILGMIAEAEIIVNISMEYVSENCNVTLCLDSCKKIEFDFDEAKSTEKWLYGLLNIIGNAYSSGNAPRMLPILFDHYGATKLAADRRYLPYINALCTWQVLAAFGHGLGGHAFQHQDEREIQIGHSILCSQNQAIRSISSLQKVKASEQDVLWLARQELNFLSLRYNVSLIAEYIQTTFSSVPKLSASFSFTSNFESCEEQHSGTSLQLFRAISNVNSSARFTFLSDLISSHSRLAVFWDEMGDRPSSYRHQIRVLELFRYIFCVVPDYLDNLFLVIGRGIASYAEHYFQDLALKHREALMRSSLSCLYSQTVASSPAIFSSLDQFKGIRMNQFAEIKRVESFLSLYPDDINVDRLTFLRSYFLSLYLRFSLTPPTMMVGYQSTGIKSDIQDTELLSLSHICLRNCIGAIPDFQDVDQKLRSRIKIGFISSFFFDHSVGRLMNHVIRVLDRNKFHVHAISVSGWRGHATVYEESDEFIDQLCKEVESCIPIAINMGQGIHCPQSITGNSTDWKEMMGASGVSIPCAISVIRLLLLDIAIFPELGMDFSTLAIAASGRLAPIQAVFWGHPLPQGIENIDYFVSSSYFKEERQFSWRYPGSEQLVLFDSLTTFFLAPKEPVQLVGDSIHLPSMLAEFLKICASPRIYFLPHTVMKFSVEFSSVLANLLVKDSSPSSIVVVVYSSTQKLWLTAVLRRLRHDVAAIVGHNLSSFLMSRLFPIERLSQTGYYYFLSKYHPLILDTFPFGMGVTALEAFSFGVPIITFPSAQTVPALVYGFARKLNHSLSDCLISNSSEEYVAKAMSAMTNCHPTMNESDNCCKQNLERMLRMHSRAIYQDTTVVDEWGSFFQKIIYNKEL